MTSINDSFISSMALTIKAIDKINQHTGGMKALLQKPASGGTAVANIIINSLGRSSGGVPEIGKGSNVNASA